jgi:hypothetical protein
VPPDGYFIHLLTWLELGPLGTNDPHFAITPAEPGSGVGESDPGLASDSDQVASYTPTGVGVARNQTRQDQRDAERNITTQAVARAVLESSNTSANRAAQEAAEREMLDVASRVTLTP